MPGKSTVGYGNELFDIVFAAPALPFPTLAANASTTTNFTVPAGIGMPSIDNVLPGDLVQMSMQAPPAHLFMDNAYVSAPGVITITWSTDGTGVTGATVNVIFNLVRYENVNLGTGGSGGFASIPTSPFP